MNGVLIIDDNPVDVRLQARVLKRCSRFGPINSASNGQEALDILSDPKKHNPSSGIPPILVLLDVNMPVLDGFGFLSNLQESNELRTNYKIVMLTSSNAEIDRKRAEQFDLVDRFLVKPLTLEDANALAQQYLPEIF